MRKYFTQLLKKNLLPFACLTLFCLIIYVLPISVHSYDMWNNNYDNFIAQNGVGPYIDIYHGNISIALGIMCVFVPMFMFAYKMNKRSVDMHYSLPINKTKILISHFLVGLILTLGSYTIAYFLGFVAITIKVEHLHLINYLWLYLGSLIPAFVIYSITSFIYTRANTKSDGAISVIGTICIFAAFVLMISDFVSFCSRNNSSHGISADSFLPFVALSEVRTIFGELIKYGKSDYLWFSKPQNSVRFTIDLCALISSVLWTILGITATFGLIFTEKKSKAENCGQISESIFCYRIQIPIYTIMFVATALVVGDFYSFIVVVFAMYVLMAIYRRTFKIGSKYAIILGLSIACGMILYAIPAIIINLIR